MNIIDYKGNQIKTIKESNNNTSLVIFYPGYRYTLNAPVFFYLQELFMQKGFDILGIDYRYHENADFLSTTDEEKQTWFRYDCNAIGKAIKNYSEGYKRIIYVGKSLGTIVLLNQLKDGLIQEKAEIILLTPATDAHEIYLTIQKIQNRILIVYGNADKYYNKMYIDLLKGRKDVFIKVIEKAGHVFEEAGNIKQSIFNLEEVISTICDFT